MSLRMKTYEQSGFEKKSFIRYNIGKAGDRMPNSVWTKRIFADTLKQLMETTPFVKISIGEITKACGMNRNSFYYHFRDKYELLNWIFLTEVTEEINRADNSDFPGSSWELLARINRYLYANQAFYANAMEYEGQDSFVDYFRGFFRSLLETRSDELLEQSMDPEFREFYLDFILDAMTVTIIRWIRSGAKYPPDRFTEMIRRAAAGTAHRILEEEEPV